MDTRVQLTTHIDQDFHAKNEIPITVARYCQSVRNQYLKSNLHGERFIRIDCEGDDPVPKKIMRVAAGLRAFEKTPSLSPDAFDSVDLLEGLDFLTVLLNEQKDEHEAVRSLRDWLAKHRRGRGSRSPMTPDQLLLLCEIFLIEQPLQLSVP
jgi:pol beta superfamily nucleotidyltransferase in conflict system